MPRLPLAEMRAGAASAWGAASAMVSTAAPATWETPALDMAEQSGTCEIPHRAARTALPRLQATPLEEGLERLPVVSSRWDWVALRRCEWEAQELLQDMQRRSW